MWPRVYSCVPEAHGVNSWHRTLCRDRLTMHVQRIHRSQTWLTVQKKKNHYNHHNLSLNRDVRWGTTDDFAYSFLHVPLFSTALWDLANSMPVHSLMLSSHLLLCLPCLLLPFTVPCMMVLDRSDERETWRYHCSLRLFTTVRIACWILAWTSSLVTWSLYEMRGILPFLVILYVVISMACILLWSSAVRVHDSQAYKKMDVTRERISRILELREILLSFKTDFNLVNAAVVCAILAWNSH